MLKLTLNDVFYNDITQTTGGIFNKLYTVLSSEIATNFPWLANKTELDTEYLFNHSGDKAISPIVRRMIEYNVSHNVQNPYNLTDAQITTLANIIINRCKKTWIRLWNDYNATYNPLHNYDSTETETPDISKKHKVSADFKAKQTQSTKLDTSKVVSNGTTAKYYGFNSGATGQKVSETDNNNLTEHTTADDTNNKTVVENEQMGYTEDTESGTRTITRQGNIGVTSTVDLLTQDKTFWAWKFVETVFKDVDATIALHIYY